MMAAKFNVGEGTDMANHTWFRSEFEKAKKFNSELPPHARLVVSSPVTSAGSRTTQNAEHPPASEPDQPRG